MDDELLAAPNILSPIRSEGQISGNFTREEVDRMVHLLKSGLPPGIVDPPRESKIEMPKFHFLH